MRLRRWGLFATVGLAAVGTAGCEPPPPLVTFEVNSTTPSLDDHDANPGDGICEVTVGAGDCSVGAALMEARHHPRVEIVLPSDVYYVSFYVNTDLTLRAAEGAVENPVIRAFLVDVEASAALRLVDVDLIESGYVEISGLLHTVGSTLSGLLSSTVVVHEGGTAVFVNSHLHSGLSFYGVVVNGGTVLLDHSTVSPGSDHGVYTSPGNSSDPPGRTLLRASAILGHAEGPSCGGIAPESLGGNLSTDSSCALAGTGDIENASDSGPVPAPGSPRIDANPVGSAGCGGVPVDVEGNPRPADGDGDGIAACDIGAWEVQPG